jgi:3-hydroxyacyl-[acyl-carrier protein] dehydratase/trans-2-decenoyl-[acyl-carrier protein] isomerase
MPGCLGLDAMWQIVGYWLGWSGSPGKGRAVGVGEVKFRGDIKPDIKRVRYEVSMRQVRRGKLLLELQMAACLPTTHACISPRI